MSIDDINLEMPVEDFKALLQKVSEGKADFIWTPAWAEAALTLESKLHKLGRTDVQVPPALRPLQKGEDFYFCVPNHPAGKMLAERLKRLGIARATGPFCYQNDQMMRFYLPQGTDPALIAKEYSEYFSADEAPSYQILPLSFLSGLQGRWDDGPEIPNASFWPPCN